MALPFKIKKEDELLVLLAQTSMSSETNMKINNLLEEGVNWDYLVDKASIHALRPLMYFNLKNYSDKVPEDVFNSLNDFYFRNAQSNLLFTGEMIKLLKLFKTHNLKVIPYKGPIMAYHGYGDLTLREFADLDLFVEKKEFSQVKELLIHGKYEPILKLNYDKELEYMKSQREYKFKNIENGINLEIQWNVVGFSFSFPNGTTFHISPDDFQFIFLNNQRVEVFSDEDLLLILSIHVAGHMWSRLSWICDIVELLNGSESINWNQVMEKAHLLAIERILYLNLSLAHKLFNIQIPKSVQEKIKNDTQIPILEKQVFNLFFYPEKVSILNKISLRFKIRENKLNGLKDIIKILTIPQSEEWSSFENKMSTTLLYIFKRPFQIINRLKE